MSERHPTIRAVDLPIHLGQRVREVRQQRGMTQEELAAALSTYLDQPISRSTLGNYETGRRPMPAELLLLIADICAISLQDFALHRSVMRSETADMTVQSAPETTRATPSVDDTEVLTLITQTLRARPDVVPFVLEMLAAFVEDSSHTE